MKTTSARFCLAVLFLALLSGAPASTARAAQVSLTQHYVHDAMVLDGPLQFDLVDLDRDGDLDLIVAEQYDQELSWVENTGGGSFASARSLTVLPLGGEVWGVAAGDLDGDGDLDMVGAQGHLLSASDKEVFWFENTGPGMEPITWSAKKLLETGTGGPGALYVRDLDRDGDNDVVAVLQSDEAVVWYENTDGAGSFAAAAVIGTLSGMRGSALFDLDRDGDLDVLAAVDDAVDGIYLMENAGAFPFEPPVLIASVGDANVLDVADLDRDGWVDLLVGTDADADACYRVQSLGPGVMMGDPPVLFNTPVLLGALNSPGDIRGGDLDGDGDADVAATSLLGDEVMWYDNDAGTFTARVIDAAEVRPLQIRLGDLDHDGDLDPVVASQVTDDVTWHENLSPHVQPVFNEAAATLLDDAASNDLALASADLDGDGDLDIAYAGIGSGEVGWLENDGTGDFAAAQVLAAVSDPRALVAADLDRDGDTDLVVAARGDGMAPLWLENPGGAGSWSAHTTSYMLTEESLSLGDVDGDGDQDILVATDADTVLWLENRLGDGVNDDINVAANVVSSSVTGARTVEAADLDADGDLDLIVAAGGLWSFVYFVNDGAGGFGMAQALPGTFVEPASIVAADFDGDGDTDLLGGTLSDALLVWWENTGTGFAAPETLADNATNSVELGAVDLDRDGDVDPFYLGGGDVLWAENFGGTFAAPAILAESGAALSRVVSGDFDGDGKHDLAISDAATGRVLWLRNAGARFSLSAVALAPASAPEQSEALLFELTFRHNGVPGDPEYYLKNMDLLFEESPADPLTEGEFHSLVYEVRFRKNLGDPGYDPEEDALFMIWGSPLIDSGVVHLEVPDEFMSGIPELQLAAQASGNYFLTVQLRDTLSTTDPAAFRVTLLESGNVVLDLDTELPVEGSVSGVSTGQLSVENSGVSILYFETPGGTIVAGQFATLYWETDLADSCEISNDVDASIVSLDSFELPDGSLLISPSQDTTYTITCQGPGGPVSESVLVDVDLPPVGRNDFYDTPVDVTLSVGVPSGVLSNDDDGEAIGPVGVSDADVVSARGGAVDVGIGGDFVYVPPAGFAGVDTFEYEVTDGYSTDTARVSIQVGAALSAASGPRGGGCTLSASGESGAPLGLLLAAVALAFVWEHRRA